VRVAVIGGTGSFGRALVGRLLERGEDVLIGSRDRGRALELAKTLGVEGGTNEEVVEGVDLAVLAVKAEAALLTAEQIAAAIGETPLPSVASALHFSRDGVRPDPEARSLAERIADRVQAPVAAGLHTLAAANLAGDPRLSREDVLVCGDDPHAKNLALAIGGLLVGGCAIDAGPLASARALEGLTAVIINVNRRYRSHAGIRMNGVSVGDHMQPAAHR
jgi:8-hydroxy-5-deazaflavin:NADPH oxidoreductase